MEIYARLVGVVHQGGIVGVLDDALMSAALLAGRQDQGAGTKTIVVEFSCSYLGSSRTPFHLYRFKVIRVCRCTSCVVGPSSSTISRAGIMVGISPSPAGCVRVCKPPVSRGPEHWSCLGVVARVERLQLAADRRPRLGRRRWGIGRRG
jgi:hypothetical protein